MVRPEVRNFEPYLPGKPIEEVQRELGLKKIIKLASNENALGASKKVQKALREAGLEVFRYPEGPGTLLRRAIAKRSKVKEEEVILGAGSDELIEVLAKAFFNPGDEVVVSEHAFIRYKMAADLMGSKSVIVPMKNMAHDLEAMAGKIGNKTKAVFVANPNNPTGTYVNERQVKAFFAKVASLKLDPAPFIVFDEAYYEFAKGLASDYPESLDYFGKGFNLVVLRTFSKIYGLAGLRVGYGIARKEVVEVLDRVRPPFNVSNVAQKAALAAMTDDSHLKKSLKSVRMGMSYLSRELKDLKLDYIPSAGNFILIDAYPKKGKDLFARLLKKGVIIRAMDEYGFPNCVRVTVGLEDENKFFIDKLKEVLKENDFNA